MFVPRDTRVLVHARTGNVDVVDVSGAIDVDVVAGDVRIERSVGRINVTVVAGNVSLVSAEGTVHIGAVSGDVLIEDVRGDLEVSGTSSEVTLRRVRSTRVSAGLVSGSVSFDGALLNNGRYEFTSHSGNVQLYIADDARGEMEVQSFNGELHTSIPLTTVADGSPAPPARVAKGARNYSLNARQRFEFGGGGGAQVIISTFSGDVNIARGPRR